MHPIFLLFFAAMAAPSTLGMTHVVGGRIGWSVPPNSTFYRDWAKPRTFGAGDKLIFPYRMSLHNVLEVSEEDFNECTQKAVIGMYFDAPLIISLNKTGHRYFYSGIGMQCEAGVKLDINVVQGEGSSGIELPFHV